MIINQISYRGSIDIELTHKTTKGEEYLEWSFVYNGNRYANALKFKYEKGMKVADKKNKFIGAVASVVANACKTYEDLIQTKCEKTSETL